MSTDKTIIVETKEELQRLRNKLDKVKVVILNEFGKHPLTNILDLPYRERNIIKEEIENVFNTITDDQLNEKFNKICIEKLFTNNAKIEDYPIYNRSLPTDETEVLYDASGNLIIV